VGYFFKYKINSAGKIFQKTFRGKKKSFFLVGRGGGGSVRYTQFIPENTVHVKQANKLMN